MDLLLKFSSLPGSHYDTTHNYFYALSFAIRRFDNNLEDK